MSGRKPCVLLVRPEGRRESTVRLEAMGFAVLHLPMQRIEPVAVDLPDALPSADLGICVSVAAAERVVFCDALAAAARSWLAVGPGSAAVLQRSGIVAQTPSGEYSSEGLLDMPLLQDVAGVRIALCRGVGGRELLAETLRTRGGDVMEFALYRRVAVDYADAIDADMRDALLRADAVLLSSVESTELLCGLLGRCGLSPAAVGVAFALSERIAQTAHALGFDCLRVGQSATLETLYNEMHQHFF